MLVQTVAKGASKEVRARCPSPRPVHAIAGRQAGEAWEPHVGGIGPQPVVHEATQPPPACFVCWLEAGPRLSVPLQAELVPTRAERPHPGAIPWAILAAHPNPDAAARIRRPITRGGANHPPTPGGESASPPTVVSRRVAPQHV
jgi:hypothetical protein